MEASKCNHCGVELFAWEAGSATRVVKEFCCGKGKYIGPSLAPYDSPYYNEETKRLDGDVRRNASTVNMLLALSATSFEGGRAQQKPGGPQMVKIKGRTFHVLTDLNHLENQPGRLRNSMCIYDGDKRKELALAFKVDEVVINEVHHFLSNHNPLFQQYIKLAREGGDKAGLVFQKVSRRTHGNVLGDAPTSDFIAGVLISADEGPRERAAVVWKNGDPKPRNIDILDPAYEALAYPMLFPEADAGWDHNMVSDRGERVTQMLRYRHLILAYHRFTAFPRLTQEYIVDMFDFIR